jgi:hypothetical protein
MNAAARTAASARVPLLAGLTAAFALRVIGQAVQDISPQPWLPAFGAFQGSGLTYPLLVAAQVAILIAMVAVTCRVAQGRWSARPAVVRTLRALGRAYLVAMLARLAIGVEMPEAGAWFAAWIPAVFHVVLATFVLTWAAALTARHADARRSTA